MERKEIDGIVFFSFPVFTWIKLEKYAANAIEMVLRKHSVSYQTHRKCFARLRVNDFNLEDDEHSTARRRMLGKEIQSCHGYE